MRDGRYEAQRTPVHAPGAERGAEALKRHTYERSGAEPVFGEVPLPPLLVNSIDAILVKTITPFSSGFLTLITRDRAKEAS
jgi:hypothetical protein